MKKKQGNRPGSMTSVLHTPVGSYSHDDVLEGFAADTEHLGRSNEGNKKFDQGFYRLCKLENLYIFDFLGNEPFKIPPMTLSQLSHILFRKMKPGKACDIYQVTVEHLRYCGDQALLLILEYINRILDNLYYISCPQIKLGLGTAVYKAKKKPISKSSSYRRITVTPIIGAIIDYHLDPTAEAIFRQKQSPDQLGFTAGVSYLLASIQRGECQRWAIDKKQTCFGVSLETLRFCQWRDKFRSGSFTPQESVGMFCNTVEVPTRTLSAMSSSRTSSAGRWLSTRATGRAT